MSWSRLWGCAQVAWTSPAMLGVWQFGHICVGTTVKLVRQVLHTASGDSCLHTTQRTGRNTWSKVVYRSVKRGCMGKAEVGIMNYEVITLLYCHCEEALWYSNLILHGIDHCVARWLAPRNDRATQKAARRGSFLARREQQFGPLLFQFLSLFFRSGHRLEQWSPG